MTLLNLYLEPERVLLFSDTLVSHHGAPRTLATKILILPHALAVLASRGPVEALWGVAQRLEVHPTATGSTAC